MRNVYYDVENTLEVPFITGIQRVVREFSRVVLCEPRESTEHNFIPVIHDHKRQSWRHLDRKETRALLSATPRSTSFISRGTQKITRLLPKPKSVYIGEFEAGSVFLDIESSWHSRLSRAELLPRLKQSGIGIAKLHYDTIPLLFPQTTHPDTIKVFTGHFLSHLQHTDLFLCISNRTRDDVQAYCDKRSIQPPRMRTVQLGCCTDGKQPGASVSNGSAAFGKYILSVGTIEPRKNYSLLMQAFEALRQTTEINLVIVGKRGWLADDILSLIHNHPDYGTRIHHLEHISDAELDSLYRNAWLCVITSLYEGFGLPLTEALARGCPTISSTAGSLREVGANHVLFFEPDSVSSLTSLILQQCIDESCRQKLLQAAADFLPVSWQQTARDIDQHLNALLSN